MAAVRTTPQVRSVRSSVPNWCHLWTILPTASQGEGFVRRPAGPLTPVLSHGEGALGVFWLCPLLGDFRLRSFRQIDFKGSQYLTNEQIMSHQGRDLQCLLHANAIPHSVERRIADFVVT